MALGSQPRWTTRPADTVVGIDAGLREYMLRVYNYMASGLALTGIVAYVAAYSGFYESIARTPLIWLVILAPLGLVMLMSFGVQRMQASTLQLVFWLYAGLMGLIGIIIASLVNMFIGSSALQFAISVIGVIVFVGLTAWDTQQIKEMYVASDDGQVAGKKSIMGALRLYLDFLNLFLMLMQLFGQRRD